MPVSIKSMLRSSFGKLKSICKCDIYDKINPTISQVSDQIILADKSSAATKISQIELIQSWKRLVHDSLPLPSLSDVEFRCFSQNGEDGIILYLLALIGVHNKTCVELCAGDGIQCNTSNLIINHGWNGLLVDGNESLVKKGLAFYRSCQDTFSFPPSFAHAWIDRESVNSLLQEHGFSGEVDILSIDLDGVDYWIWEAISIINPRIVVAEVQCIWGSEYSVSVPYDRDFSSPLVEGFGIYSGASLPAFVRLAKRKGYRLVGTQALGFNAFFVRNDLANDLLPEVSAQECLDKPFVKWASAKFLPMVRDFQWVNV